MRSQFSFFKFQSDFFNRLHYPFSFLIYFSCSRQTKLLLFSQELKKRESFYLMFNIILRSIPNKRRNYLIFLNQRSIASGYTSVDDLGRLSKNTLIYSICWLTKSLHFCISKCTLSQSRAMDEWRDDLLFLDEHLDPESNLLATDTESQSFSLSFASFLNERAIALSSMEQSKRLFERGGCGMGGFFRCEVSPPQWLSLEQEQLECIMKV